MLAAVAFRRLVPAAAAAQILGGAFLTAAAMPQATPDEGRFLIASQDDTGYVAIGAFGVTPGSVVEFAETVGAVRGPLSTVTAGPVGIAALPRAVAWRCDRRVRSFVATATAPDGTVQTATTDLRTPSCAERVAVTVPAHADRRSLVTIRLVDRWTLGRVNVSLCSSGAGLDRTCRTVRLSTAKKAVTRRVRPPFSGRVKLRVTVARHTTAAEVAVGRVTARPQHTGPLVLMTGDSTIEGIGSGLEDVLGARARIRAQSAPGTRLSGAGEPDWQRRAAGQVRRLHPTVVALSLGGNEGFPIIPRGATTEVACCGADWIAALSARQGRLMDTFDKGGRASVVWLTIPVPRSTAQADIVAAVNAGIVRAARSRPKVRVLDLGAIFTPDGVYHDAVRRGGHDVQVRAPDGLHLSAAGQQIAANALAARLDKDDLLG